MTEIVEVEQPQVPANIGKWRAYPTYKDSGVEWLGEIPEHWNVLRLKHVFKVFNGATPSSTVSSYWDGNIPWVTPEDLGSLSDGLISSTSRTITEEGYQSCGTSIVPVGSLILSTRAPIGHIAIATIPLCTNQGCRSLVFRRLSVQPFFFYLLLTMKQELQSWGQGSTFLELGKSKLETMRIISPPLPEQSTIATVLDHETSKINTLIAKKERLIGLLREKRAALISHAVTKGLDPDVKMKDSGVEWLGEIPERWEVYQLRRIVNTFVDYRGFTPTKTSHGIPLITARNIRNGTLDFTNSQEFISEEDYDTRMVRGFPKSGDVLITTEAPLGETAQIVDENVTLAQRIILLKVDKLRITNDCLKYYFISSSGQGELWSRATGSTAIGIKASHLKEVMIVVPPLVEQQAITSFLDQETTKIDALISKIGEAIEKLKEYSAALISAAVTGKIDVREKVSSHEE